MAQHIQIRRDTAANWSSVNPTLLSGELALETTTGRFKFGDGVTPWNSLSYATFDLRTLLKQGDPTIYTASAVGVIGNSTSVVTAILMNTSGASNYTINTGVFPVGDSVNVVQYGTGQVTLVGGGGVTLRSSVGLKTRTRYSMLTAAQVAPNEWIIGGDVVA